ncbi:MAG: branched-chain amino acid ABC transporter permease, partial [bacterium]
MVSFLRFFINGISLGSVYAIIALGYTMVYGIAKMLNFAHGDIIMVGAYISFCAMTYMKLPPLLAVLCAMAVCTALGVVIEGLAYRPLRQAAKLAVLITAIGVSYFLQNTALLIWSSNPKVFPSVFNIGAIRLFDGNLVISSETILTIVTNIVIMIALTLFTGRTKMGKAMRAVSEDKGAAELMGINVNRTISVTFAIGSALAAIAGVLLCSSYPTLQPTTGSMPGIKAFTAAVFGGIGSIPGAMLGGLLLGII